MKEINFTAKTPEIMANVPPPRPAKLYIPDWYKKLPKFENNKFKIKILENGSVQANATAKSCMPFMDSLMMGYIQETWCDIYIENLNGEIKYAYANNPEIMSVRDRVSIEGLSSNDFYPVEFVWRQPWVPKVPKGYSVIYTHPLNRIDLPFYSLSGVIDNDSYVNETAGNHPFFIKNGFTGIIPTGTPMFQIIPIKRESWSNKISEPDKNYKYNKGGVNKFFFDGYKKLFWNKKEYN
jgi:hypothetical protein